MFLQINYIFSCHILDVFLSITVSMKCNGIKFSLHVSNQRDCWLCFGQRYRGTQNPQASAGMKTKSHHDTNFVITSGTTGCHRDNLQCLQ